MMRLVAQLLLLATTAPSAGLLASAGSSTAAVQVEKHSVTASDPALREKEAGGRDQQQNSSLADTVWTPFDGLPALPKVHFPNRDYTFSDPSPFNLSLSSELVRITGACPICEWHWLAARANPLHLSPFSSFFRFPLSSCSILFVRCCHLFT